MGFSERLESLHAKTVSNRWMRYFTTFTRFALIAGFLPPGWVKIIGERFTDLHNNQPMGHYLEALHHTGYYYTFVGYAQILAALLLLFPRTVVLGVLIYLPIILNICILSLAVRFEGSLLTAPAMVVACIYLLCWNYDRIKYILPFNTPPTVPVVQNNKFPIKFFASIFLTFILFVYTITHMYDILPRNTQNDCVTQCDDSENPAACQEFCKEIHTDGKDLDESLDRYFRKLEGKKQ
ncbi:hypothetical protein [Daejeonella lutea]|uniref:DoxX protein n=1 Tax=Daejeonella lutea TaxID=572036 RepID=A0A1T5AJF1_9SPHI|nr:hypothetical protein [Daejeonella lutea]SKB35124.1 hypothetical protein SAMN05661099_0796 [Daejeonella lutea]